MWCQVSNIAQMGIYASPPASSDTSGMGDNKGNEPVLRTWSTMLGTMLGVRTRVQGRSEVTISVGDARRAQEKWSLFSSGWHDTKDRTAIFTYIFKCSGTVWATSNYGLESYRPTKTWHYTLTYIQVFIWAELERFSLAPINDVVAQD